MSINCLINCLINWLILRYFEGGLSSVYFWDLEQGFGAVILIKKQAEGLSVKGCWDSIHIVECKVSLLYSDLFVLFYCLDSKQQVGKVQVDQHYNSMASNG